MAGILDNGDLKDDNSITIKCISKVLSQDIVFVARSIGLIAEYHKEIENIEETTYYNVFVSNISGDLGDIPFQRLEVGSADFLKILKYMVNTFKIVPKGVGKYFGFTISEIIVFY